MEILATKDFVGFPKMARLSRSCVITEKIDGTNAQICITDEGDFLIGSRNRWLTPQSDNHGFAKWATEHKNELLQLGPGRHFGEWWGSGIQRGYGLPNGDKRFSLFNISRWCLANQEPQIISQDHKGNIRYQEKLPACVGLVPIIIKGEFDNVLDLVTTSLELLREKGSFAAPFMNPEGIVVFHTAADMCFKKTLENDAVPKSMV